jgi:DNA-binding GntR family transcriptional regulator
MALAPLPRRQMVVEDTYAALREALLANRIAPGVPLKLDALAAEFGVSVTPIREALARLETEGLVIKQPYRGWAASALLDRPTIERIYDARLLLEPALARRASAMLSAEHVRELRATLEPPPTELGEEERIAAWVDLDARLHHLISTVAGNDMITEFLSRLGGRMKAYQSFYGRPTVAVRAVQEHRRIVEALAAGDAAAAESAMREHLDAALSRLRHAFG